MMSFQQVDDVVGASGVIAALEAFATSHAAWTVASGLTANHSCVYRDEVDMKCYAGYNWDAGNYHLNSYQSLGTNAGVASTWPDCSGQGNTSTAWSTHLRNVHFGDVVGAYGAADLTVPHMWMFASDEPPYYIHCVVQTTDDEEWGNAFRHFGFGLFVKRGTYVGGEYSYANNFLRVTGTGHQSSWQPYSSYAAHFLDGAAGNQTVLAAVVHLEGLPGQAVNSKWGLCGGESFDRSGVARQFLAGSARGGCLGWEDLSHIAYDQAAYWKPLIPIEVFYRRTTGRFLPIGYMPDTKIVNIKNIPDASEVMIDGEPWMSFPWIRKRIPPLNGVGYTTGLDNQERYSESRCAGVLYKKIEVAP